MRLKNQMYNKYLIMATSKTQANVWHAAQPNCLHMVRHQECENYHETRTVLFSPDLHTGSLLHHTLSLSKSSSFDAKIVFFLFFFSSVSKWTRQHDKRCHTESNQRHIFSFTCFWSIFLYTDFIKKENKYISHPGFIILLHLNKIICCSSFLIVFQTSW